MTDPRPEPLPDLAPSVAPGADNHLLMNALNAISGLLLGQGETRAEAALVDFSRLLRMRLRTTGAYSLDDEVEDLEAYLRIAALRFPGRIGHRVRIDARFGDLTLAPVAAMVGALCDTLPGTPIRLDLTVREHCGIPLMRVAVAADDTSVIAEAFTAMLANCRAAGAARTRMATRPFALVGTVRWGGDEG